MIGLMQTRNMFSAFAIQLRNKKAAGLLKQQPGGFG